MTDVDEADHYLFRVGWAPSDVDDPIAILRNLRKQIEELEIDASQANDKIKRLDAKIDELDEENRMLKRKLVKATLAINAAYKATR